MNNTSIPQQAPIVPDHQPSNPEPNVYIPSEHDMPVLSRGASADSSDMEAAAAPLETDDDSYHSRRRPSLMRKMTDEAFRSTTSVRARLQATNKENVGLQVVYLGIAIAMNPEDENELAIGITTHDSTYSIDYERYSYKFVRDTDLESSFFSDDGTIKTHVKLIDFVLRKIGKYRENNYYKIVGAGITEEAHALCPQLRSRLWSQLDIVCFKFKPFGNDPGNDTTPDEAFDVRIDEESDSVVRKAIEQFGPNNMPRLMVKFHNEVGVDVDNQTELATLEDYRETVHPNTWKATMHYVESLKKNGTRIAFFNATPQGGGVALMRHALIRFLRLAGVDCKWYVPRPNHEVFRTTKDNHNILQGVNTHDRLDAKKIEALDSWCEANALRYWAPQKKRNGKKMVGPLSSIADGGAHVIIIDDPQLPMLADIAKQNEPNRPVIYRSHIQINAELVDTPGTPASQVWDWVWNHVQKCDLFISHPVRSFIPSNVTPSKVGYMPATTDWLDGLGKFMSAFDLQYYMHEFYLETRRVSADPAVHFALEHADLHRPYIVQIARFDPAKGIPTVIAAYAHFRREYASTYALRRPQLIIAGHGAIDDPDALPIYTATMSLIAEKYADIARDIIVMRVGPSDQILNTLLSNAHVALQLSVREGFEVKVSEAQHHGKPIIATRTGGIPLQVRHNQSGFLVDDPTDYKQVAKYLDALFRDNELYDDMADAAAKSCSDEVSTVGNALCWLYLADALARGETVVPRGKWVNDMAREEAGVLFDGDSEVRIERGVDLEFGATEE